MSADSLNFNECFEAAKQFHGHVCGGITIGTRMAILGMKSVDIIDPFGKDSKDLMVFVEIDRCATDAILAVTGCHPGKRSMKIIDYGKMAATFVNLKTGKAVRIAAKNREGEKIFTKEMMQQNTPVEDYSKITDEELFYKKEVRVSIKPEDLPGKPLRTVPCSSCGERILDAREVVKDGKALCKPCSENTFYYSEIK
jgi:formylmethanofuran dehydrogenase subunit E